VFYYNVETNISQWKKPSDENVKNYEKKLRNNLMKLQVVEEDNVVINSEQAKRKSNFSSELFSLTMEEITKKAKLEEEKIGQQEHDELTGQQQQYEELVQNQESEKIKMKSINPMETEEEKLKDEQVAENEEDNTFNNEKEPSSVNEKYSNIIGKDSSLMERSKHLEKNDEQEQVPKKDILLVCEKEAAGERSDEEKTFGQRVDEFKQMLREKNLAAFSTWDKELPKLAFDPRFKVLPNHSDRRAVFQQYIRNKLEEERQMKKKRLENMKKIILLSMEDSIQSVSGDIQASPTKISPSISLEKFIDSFDKVNETFKALSSKEKEKLYNDIVGPLKRAEREREQKELEIARNQFNQLLKETRTIHSRSSWHKTKEILRRDERYFNKQLSSSEKESLFRSYCSTLGEEERKLEREEARRRERERELLRIRESEARERGRSLAKVHHEESLMNYKILLKEKIRDPEVY